MKDRCHICIHLIHIFNCVVSFFLSLLYQLINFLLLFVHEINIDIEIVQCLLKLLLKLLFTIHKPLLRFSHSQLYLFGWLLAKMIKVLLMVLILFSKIVLRNWELNMMFLVILRILFCLFLDCLVEVII